VRVRNFREGKEKWIRGKVVKRLGSVSYLINDGVRDCTVHIDHLLLSYEDVVDCNTLRDDPDLTPDLDSPQPSSNVQEAEGRISTPIPACALMKSATLPARRSPASRTHSPVLFGNTLVKPAEPVAVSAATQEPGRHYPDHLQVTPKRLNF